MGAVACAATFVPRPEPHQCQAGCRPLRRQRRNEQETPVIRIVELKYAPDLDIHRARARAMAQHDALRKSLLAAGWGRVTIHPVIIGNAGTITAETLTVFERLGIDTASATALAKSIAISSIRHTAKIKRARLSHGAGPSQTAEQADSSGPQADPSPGPSTARGQQPSTADAAGADPLANGHPSQNPSGEASSPSAANAMLPVTLSDAACALACNASPALTPEPDEWQPAVRGKRQKGPSQPVTTLAQTDSTVCSRPDRACKRPRGSYAILADLDEEEPSAVTAAPATRRGQKRGPATDAHARRARDADGFGSGTYSCQPSGSTMG